MHVYNDWVMLDNTMRVKSIELPFIEQVIINFVCLSFDMSCMDPTPVTKPELVLVTLYQEF